MTGIDSGFNGEHIELFDRVSAVLTRRTGDGDYAQMLVLDAFRMAWRRAQDECAEITLGSLLSLAMEQAAILMPGQRRADSQPTNSRRCHRVAHETIDTDRCDRLDDQPLDRLLDIVALFRPDFPCRIGVGLVAGSLDAGQPILRHLIDPVNGPAPVSITLPTSFRSCPDAFSAVAVGVSSGSGVRSCWPSRFLSEVLA